MKDRSRGYATGNGAAVRMGTGGSSPRRGMAKGTRIGHQEGKRKVDRVKGRARGSPWCVGILKVPTIGRAKARSNGDRGANIRAAKERRLGGKDRAKSRDGRLAGGTKQVGKHAQKPTCT